jgi:dUTP pyrophosphatase
LEAGEVKPVPTGIRMAVPDGYVGLVWDKSGISLRGVHRLAGVIDSGYRGEVRVVMVNLGNEAFVIEKGMKIAQLLVQPVTEMKVVETEELETTSRGEEGFGSTGKY